MMTDPTKKIDDYHLKGRCRLCDAMAKLLLGAAVEQDSEDSDSNCCYWWFESKEVARNYLFQCWIFTMGTASYFERLHLRAHNVFSRRLEDAEFLVTATSQATLKKIGDLRSDSQFIISFGDPTKTEMPFFCVVGNQEHRGRNHLRNGPLCRHDFAIAIPDLGHHRLVNDAGRKPWGNKKGAGGRVLFFRPLRPLSSDVELDLDDVDGPFE